MANEPFFRIDGDHYVPTPSARGPWNPNSLHGRVIAGLLGAEIERLHGDPAFLPARLTVDMYRLPDLSPVEVTTRVAFPTPTARARVQVGGTIPVRYDKDDHTRIVVDLPTD